MLEIEYEIQFVSIDNLATLNKVRFSLENEFGPHSYHGVGKAYADAVRLRPIVGPLVYENATVSSTVQTTMRAALLIINFSVFLLLTFGSSC